MDSISKTEEYHKIIESFESWNTTVWHKVVKKRILMIGDTGDLHGVPVDIRSYYDLFTSPVGSNWHHNEIEILWSPSWRLLFKKLDEIERADYDYVITIFSGHGRESICGTMLIINGEAGTIDAADMANLSPRQLSVFDCYRSFTAMPANTQGTVLSMSYNPIRKAYEQKIQDSLPQGIYLFACYEGERLRRWRQILCVPSLCCADAAGCSVFSIHKR